MTTTRPIKRRYAVIAAVVGMWFLASLGAFIVIRTGHWSILPSDDKAATIAQLGAFYLALFGAQFPAVAFVGFIICRSDFRRPVVVGGLVVFFFELVRLVIRVASWPRSFFSNIDWWVPVGFELTGVAIMVLLAMATARMMQRPTNLLLQT